MSVERLIANNLRVAREDLAGARLLAAAGNRNAAYLCEQAAEKIIRAVLTSEGIHGGIGHALTQMVDAIPNVNPVKAQLATLTPLAAYATTYRYPTSSRVPPAPAARDLEIHFQHLDEVLAEVSKRFGVDLDSAGSVARSPEPIR
ncbi:MAG: HEPN domain-containing protein [Myxococcota bacterium]